MSVSRQLDSTPTAKDISIKTPSNTPVEIQLEGSGYDENDELTAMIVDEPFEGLLEDINQETGIVTYTPDHGYRGEDEFTYKISNGSVDSEEGTVTIEIN